MSSGVEEFRRDRTYGCSLIGVVIALIIVSSIVMIPAILTGSIVMRIPDSIEIAPEFIESLPYLLLSFPAMLTIFLVSLLYQRSKSDTK